MRAEEGIHIVTQITKRRDYPPYRQERMGSKAKVGCEDGDKERDVRNMRFLYLMADSSL